MRVAFRADASAALGFGHLQRCLSLAAALRRTGTESVFLTRDDPVDPAARIAAAGFEARVFQAADWEADASACAPLLDALAPDWLVVDHYGLDARWHARVLGQQGRRIAALDDLADRRLQVSLLVNPNPGAVASRYRGVLPPGTRVLAGPRFAPLGPAYAQGTRHAPRAGVHSIGIFLGGTDSEGISAVALRACRDAGFTGPVEVVATSAHPHLTALRTACAADPRASLSLDLPHLADFFARHDLQIGGGGGAVLERCCIGAPAITIPWAANQVPGVEALAAEGCLLATLADPVSIAEGVRTLCRDDGLRRQLAARSRDRVDGWGALRIALVLCSRQVRLRPATSGDAMMALAWRNDPATRASSRDPRPIDPDPHRAWWERSLADTSRRLWVAHCGEIDLGVVRLDLCGESAEISIYLAPSLTGLGLGSASLAACQAQARREGIDTLEAEVLPGNTASSRMFRSAGFEERSPGRWRWSAT